MNLGVTHLKEEALKTEPLTPQNRIKKKMLNTIHNIFTNIIQHKSISDCI